MKKLLLCFIIFTSNLSAQNSKNPLENVDKYHITKVVSICYRYDFVSLEKIMKLAKDSDLRTVIKEGSKLRTTFDKMLQKKSFFNNFFKLPDHIELQKLQKIHINERKRFINLYEKKKESLDILNKICDTKNCTI